MDISINARHCTVPDSLRNQARQRLARFERMERRITAATLVFDQDSGSRRVEARLAVAGGPPLVAHDDGSTLRNALDGALNRLERQLKRRRERAIDRRTRNVDRPLSTQ